MAAPMLFERADFAPQPCAYAGKHAATIAIFLETSGFTDGRPADPALVNAVARNNTPGADVATGLGVACSYMDAGWEVQFVGPVSPDIPEDTLPLVDEWTTRLRNSSESENSANVFAPESAPTLAQLEELVYDSNPWSVFVHSASRFWGEDAGSTRPVVVRALAEKAVWLTVPTERLDGQRVSIAMVSARRLLDGMAVAGDHEQANRTSILAVRRPITERIAGALACEQSEI